MGGAFTFIGNQHRLEVGGQEYFIDLLLFHRRLRSLVAIELKIGAFQPEHKGKMEFYLEALDQQERMEGENAPIGIATHLKLVHLLLLIDLQFSPVRMFL